MVDLIVIGAGPGGYEAAIRAAQNGLKVLLFEKDEVGGTCLNRGCIPTKALLHAAENIESARGGEAWGIACTPQVDTHKLYAKKDEVVSALRGGIETLLKQNGVEVISAYAQVAGEGAVLAQGQRYQAKDILLAAGSRPFLPPIEGLASSAHVLTSDQLLAAPPPKEHLAILGGGVIGVEMASFCLSLGVGVTVIEAMPRILPNMDREISQSAAMLLKKRGARILTGARLLRAEDAQQGILLHIEGQDAPVSAQKLLVSVGRAACTDGLFAEEAPLPRMEKGRIAADEGGRTSLPHLYAVGDVTQGIQLAHAASAQGCRVADMLAGVENRQACALIPSCIYLTPEIACVGLTEEEAKARGAEAVCAKYVMSGNGRTLVAGSGRGFIKLVAEKGTGRLLGAQLMCERASDIIDELTLAISLGLSCHDMLRAVRPHPTFVEGLYEALESFDGRAIHAAPARKR